MFTYFHIAKDFTSAAGFLHDVEPQHDAQKQQAQSPREKCVWKNSMAEKINKVVKMQKGAPYFEISLTTSKTQLQINFNYL